MPFTLHTAFVPPITHALTQLSAILEKAAAFAETRKIEPSVLLNSRLAPDMFALARQVQIASDISKLGAARLTGTEAPTYPDTETTFPELQERIAKTIAYLRGFDAASFNGAEEREVLLKGPHGEIRFTGEEFLSYFVLPNVYFHITAAYSILRHNGLEIGKMDYLGPR